MDLANLYTRDNAEKGMEMQLINPDDGSVIKGDDGEPWTIIVIGTDSDRYQRILREAARKRNKTEDDGIENMASLVLDWSGLVLNKEPYVFSRDNAIKLLRDFPWIRDQVLQFAAERRNFLPKA